MQQATIDIESIYSTAGRDHHRYSGYEYLIGAYELEPSRGIDGEPLPVTLQRATGFKSKAAAQRAALAWLSANIGERR